VQCGVDYWVCLILGECVVVEVDYGVSGFGVLLVVVGDV